jgi:peptidoglycan/LPS O-acetylase OafA/YrhL
MLVVVPAALIVASVSFLLIERPFLTLRNTRPDKRLKHHATKLEAETANTVEGPGAPTN